MRPRIDFNCDLGEGCGDDEAIIRWISSASIACGGHAGDAATMRRTVALCLEHGVAIGAHPSFGDRRHFGRRELPLPGPDIEALVMQQVEALARTCVQAGARLHHVKPHGALYNLAARQRTVADAVARAVRRIDPGLLLFGLAGSEATIAGEAAGLRVVHEVFAERRYEANGRLTPRTRPDAVIDDLETSLQQVRTMLREGVVVARTGERVPVRADTLCLHGDRRDAATFARALRDALEREGVEVAPPAA